MILRAEHQAIGEPAEFLYFSLRLLFRPSPSRLNKMPCTRNSVTASN